MSSFAHASGRCRVALDAMGGDVGVDATVRAAAEVSRTTSIEVVLFGERDAIRSVLDRVEHRSGQLAIEHCRQAIGQDEKPRKALEDKPEASLTRAMLATRSDLDAFVSAGSTGAVVLAAARHLPKIEGVERAALAAVYPTPERAGNRDRFALLLDVGATVHCRPRDLLFFGYMGHAYASAISKVASPSVGLLNMGVEPTKGGDSLVEAHALLRADPVLRFIGNVEGNDIPAGRADVIVTEGLTGNVALKMAEGVGELLRHLGKWAFKENLMWRAGLMLLSSGLRQLKGITDYGEYGGAPLLGFTRPVIKAHGRSHARAIANAIKVAAKAARDGVCPRIEDCVAQHRARGSSCE